jgi:hypothetical protein
MEKNESSLKGNNVGRIVETLECWLNLTHLGQSMGVTISDHS